MQMQSIRVVSVATSFALIAASGASADQMAFSNAPTEPTVKLMAASLGLGYQSCVSPKGTLTGVFDIKDGNALVALLRSRHVDAVLDGKTLRVGCGGGSGATGATAPEAPGAASDTLGHSDTLGPLNPVPGPPEADTGAINKQSYLPQDREPERLASARVFKPLYLTVDAARDLLGALPGVKLLSSDVVPGKIVMTGTDEALNQARDVFALVDTCPVIIHVSATVYGRGNSDKRGKSYGFGLKVGDLTVGQRSSGSSAIKLDGVTASAFLDAGIDQSQVYEVFKTSGQAVLGEPVKLSNGQDIPVRAGTVISDRETVQNVAYRTAGQSLDITVTSAAGGLVGGHLVHEVSAPGASSDLGPSFSSRKVQTAFRVTEGKAVVFALSGLSREETSNELRFLGVGKSKETQNADGLLVLRFDVDECVPTRDTGH